MKFILNFFRNQFRLFSDPADLDARALERLTQVSSLFIFFSNLGAAYSSVAIFNSDWWPYELTSAGLALLANSIRPKSLQASRYIVLGAAYFWYAASALTGAYWYIQTAWVGALAVIFTVALLEIRSYQRTFAVVIFSTVIFGIVSYYEHVTKGVTELAGIPVDWISSTFITMSFAFFGSFAVQTLNRINWNRLGKLESIQDFLRWFMNYTSHEFNTGLNGISGYVSLIETLGLFVKIEKLFDELEKNDELKQSLDQSVVDNASKSFDRIQEFFNKIKINEKHLTQLVSDVVTASRLEEGHLKIEIQPDVATHDIANDIIAELGGLAQAHQVELKNEVTQDTKVQTDLKAISNILRNLTKNAILYNRPNGSVTIKSKLLSNDHWQLIVSDTGVGMNPEQITKLFEKFTRLHDDKSDKGGFGFGTIVVKGYTEALGGTIDVKSTEGKGTSFILTFPNSREATE